MALGKGGLSYEVHKTVRMCCCTHQPQIGPQEVQNLAMKPEWQLRNLAKTFPEQVDHRHIVDIREFFHDSEIPFRSRGCSRGAMACCGSCTRACNSRCPQDVLNRAHILCANIIYAQDRAEAFQKAPTPIKILYSELSEKVPRYFAIAETVKSIISPCHNKQLEKEIAEIYGNEDSPHRLDYAPAIEYETVQGTRPEEQKWRKKVDLETGEVAVLHWPRSGMCPFCLPTGLSERRRRK